jgi:hypothetical protein
MELDVDIDDDNGGEREGDDAQGDQVHGISTALRNILQIRVKIPVTQRSLKQTFLVTNTRYEESHYSIRVANLGDFSPKNANLGIFWPLGN